MRAIKKKARKVDSKRSCRTSSLRKFPSQAKVLSTFQRSALIRTGFRRTSSLGPLPWAPLVGRDGWLDLPRAQPVPKSFTVIGLVSDEFFGALLRPACSLPGYSHCFKRGHG